jgi:hypothetical protein
MLRGSRRRLGTINGTMHINTHLETLGADQEVSLTTIKDSEGNIITDPETTHAAWKEFFEVLLEC